ncbi:MAG: DoxX family protein [Halorientalis sp.]
MVFEVTGTAEAFLLGRVLFGAILGFMGLNHFLNRDQMVPYADAKGVPLPAIAVPLSGAMLAVGALSVIAGVYPAVGAGLLALFLVVTTPLMHDFWAVPEDQQQDEMINFLKNVGLLGGSLVLLALSGVAWPYAAGVGL